MPLADLTRQLGDNGLRSPLCVLLASQSVHQV